MVHLGRAAASFFIAIYYIIASLLGFTGHYSDTTKDASYYYGDGNITNVIFMIGDGMGFNSIEKAKKELNLTDTAIDSVPYKGQSRTRSASNKVTDSAAGGTALSSGVRTYNGAVGVYMFDAAQTFSRPVSLTEICRDRGMATGVVTTDKTTGATPAAFSAHAFKRQNTKDIIASELESDIDLIWGAADDLATESQVEKAGYEYIDTADEMNNVALGEKTYAQFPDELWHLDARNESPNLEMMTEKAIDVLSKDDDGFFLMVEGAHIDKNSHSNNSEGMDEAFAEFDKAIAEALDFAEKDGHTLVIITADHETGGITLKDGEYKYTKTSHSGVNVPCYVYGSDKFIGQGEAINNIEIPKRAAYTLGFTEKEFPRGASTINKNIDFGS